MDDERRDSCVCHQGDSAYALGFPELCGGPFEAIVTDPPYEIGLMGHGWDRSGVAFSREFWESALRCVHPGGHALVFGAARTHHRLMTALEDAGWEIRDVLMWLNGAGCPKSQDVGRTMRDPIKGDPAQAEKFDGFGSALKPAYEPIVLARRPLEKGLSITKNVVKYGTGALNIDACRIPAEAGAKLGANASGFMSPGWDRPWRHDPISIERARLRRLENVERAERLGRWPAHLLLDEEAAEQLDEQGGASRFFWATKVSKSELCGYNDHPTVKPLALMRYLVRLVTPPGGAVLDPFAGSGTTLVAALQENVGALGIELDQHYVDIANRRLDETQLTIEEAS